MHKVTLIHFIRTMQLGKPRLIKQSQRIMLVGAPGNGKSTFAQWLSQQLHLPCYHLDQGFYLAHWQQRPLCDFLAWQHELVRRSVWIIDGNNTGSLGMRYAHADCCVYFNYPRLYAYWRALKRRFGITPLVGRPQHCAERLDGQLLHYMWNFNRHVQPIFQKLQAQYPHVQLVEITNDKGLQQLQQAFYAA
jgi:energy-coupling factor transporter ATP-binding protein EcfA2